MKCRPIEGMNTGTIVAAVDGNNGRSRVGDCIQLRPSISRNYRSEIIASL